MNSINMSYRSGVNSSVAHRSTPAHACKGATSHPLQVKPGKHVTAGRALNSSPPGNTCRRAISHSASPANMGRKTISYSSHPTTCDSSCSSHSSNGGNISTRPISHSSPTVYLCSTFRSCISLAEHLSLAAHIQQSLC